MRSDDCRSEHFVLKNETPNFSIRKDGRDLRAASSLAACLRDIRLVSDDCSLNQVVKSLLYAALAVVTICWESHHPDPCIGLIFVREKNLAMANARQLLIWLGLSSGLLVLSETFDAFRGKRRQIPEGSLVCCPAR